MKIELIRLACTNETEEVRKIDPDKQIDWNLFEKKRLMVETDSIVAIYEGFENNDVTVIEVRGGGTFHLDYSYDELLKKINIISRDPD